MLSHSFFSASSLKSLLFSISSTNLLNLFCVMSILNSSKTRRIVVNRCKPNIASESCESWCSNYAGWEPISERSETPNLFASTYCYSSSSSKISSISISSSSKMCIEDLACFTVDFLRRYDLGFGAGTYFPINLTDRFSFLGAVFA